MLISCEQGNLRKSPAKKLESTETNKKDSQNQHKQKRVELIQNQEFLEQDLRVTEQALEKSKKVLCSKLNQLNSTAV